MRRESSNPVSGSGRLHKYITAALVFSIFSTLIVTMLAWSYLSCRVAGRFSGDSNRFVMWIGYMFNTPLCSVRLLPGFLVAHLKILLPLDLLLIFFFVLAMRIIGNYKGVEYGSAHWATLFEKRPFRKASNNPPLAHKIYLTKKSHPANNNIFTLAAPGGGKTFKVIIPGIEACSRTGKKYRQCSFFCTDTKGALYRDTSKMVRERGLPTYLLNLSNPWLSNCYNPLDNIHPERKITEIAGLAEMYAKNVRDEEASVGDSIWEETFKALIRSIWMYQYDFPINPITNKPESRGLWRTAELIRDLEIDPQTGKISMTCPLSLIMTAISRIDPLHPAISDYKYVCAGAAETVASVLFTAGSKIGIFAFPEVEALTMKNEIPIDEICVRPGAVYLNYEIGSPYRAIAALFIEQMFAAAYYIAETKYHGRLPLDLKMFLDELPNICRVYSLPQRASTSRSYGIDLVISVQSMQQLKKMFKDAENTLLNNCITHIYLGSGEQDALKQISEQLGKTTTSELSTSRSTGLSQGSNSDSTKGIGREIALPAEIFSMPDKYAIVKMQHHQPIFAEKFKTEKAKYYKELGGQGSPENSRSINDDFRTVAALHKYEYCKLRLERIREKQEV